MEFCPIPVTTIDGTQGTLESWRGQVLLIVNVASQCRFTSQYTVLELLYRRHRPGGFTVLGFPCNQFASQEPGSDAEILGFCLREFDISFPLFSKIEVNGPQAHPLYHLLKGSTPSSAESDEIEWNFTRFLVGRDGRVMQRYPPKCPPQDVEADIVRALGGAFRQLASV